MAISAFQSLHRSEYGEPRGPRSAFESRGAADPPASAQSAAEPLRPWPLILAVGGACWFLLGTTALVGTEAGEAFHVPPASEVLGYAGVFLLAALAYRIALALGWARGGGRRARLLAANCALLLAVAGSAPLMLWVASGASGDAVPQVHASLAPWLQMEHWQYWGSALRILTAPYLLGLCTVALALSCAKRGGAQLTGASASARMMMLSVQLQPHFLFNSLHAISVLVDESPRRATAMIARLGDYLRHALNSSRSPWTDLASELAGVEAYLAVQHMRFANGLRVSIEASPESLQVCVPALLLQPLAENAIEHGRDDTGAVLHVQITAAVIGARLCIVVGNNNSRLRTALAPAQFRHGLANVEQRLQAAYGTAARLSIAPGPGATTVASLDVPWREFAAMPASALPLP